MLGTGTSVTLTGGSPGTVARDPGMVYLEKDTPGGKYVIDLAERDTRTARGIAAAIFHRTVVQHTEWYCLILALTSLLVISVTFTV
ncbi:MAG: hypothetical protein NVSMB52_18010 [Chloroflexota bacterium]